MTLRVSIVILLSPKYTHTKWGGRVLSNVERIKRKMKVPTNSRNMESWVISSGGMILKQREIKKLTSLNVTPLKRVTDTHIAV